jgi:hypothetical protein
MEHLSSSEIFLHVRVLLGTVIGLGLARLIMTIAGIIQHPNRARSSLLHILWVFSMIIELVLFWWWELSLYSVHEWTFGVTGFLVIYAMLLVLIATILAPDHISEYAGYEDFFLKRRRWFFGLFAMVAIFDVIDNAIKGGVYSARFGDAYTLQAGTGIIVALIACYSNNRALHLTIVGVHFIYQAYLVSKYFNG